MRDRKFYESSGGGLTLSGGEPSTQADFSLELLRRSKKEGLHTALDTCGAASWKTMQTLLEYTDLVLYDIKCLDAAAHRKATGKSNELILENLRKIAVSRETWIRIPLAPGFNDSEEEVEGNPGLHKKRTGADKNRFAPLQSAR